MTLYVVVTKSLYSFCLKYISSEISKLPYCMLLFSENNKVEATTYRTKNIFNSCALLNYWLDIDLVK